MLTDPNFAPWRGEALKHGCASSLALPLLVEGKAIGAVTIYSKVPHGFSDEEVELLSQLAGDLAYGITTLRARESRNQAETALRLSEEQYRLLFNSLLEGFCIIEAVFDDHEKPVDYRFLLINPAFEQQTGLHDAEGKLMRDLAPDHEDHWFEIYGKVALTGEPARFVNQASALGRWFDVSAYRVGGEGSRKVAILFNDITTQKLNESQMLNLNEELEFRVKERTFELRTAVAALEAEIAERQRLESEILKVSEYEQSRIGQDLHDGVCQNLAALGVLAEITARNLDREESPTAQLAREIAQLARTNVEEVRRLSAGLYPVKIEHHGLEWALGELADTMNKGGNTQCRFIKSSPIPIDDTNAAVQIFRIAQEAVSNAVRHGQAPNIIMELAGNDGSVCLSIRDDGAGMSGPSVISGLGLHTMKYRATSLGGSLEVRSEPGCGTTVVCSVPVKKFIPPKAHGCEARATLET
jgi:signal transduction histidine kinase